MDSEEYFIQKAHISYSNIITYRVGIWRFSFGYSYFTGVEISQSSVTFLNDVSLGFGNPKDSVEIQLDIYHYILKILQTIQSNFINWVNELPTIKSREQAVIAIGREQWCLCDNGRELLTESADDGIGFNDNNWYGSVDGFNICAKANTTLDTFTDIIQLGETRYISHAMFDILNKALSYEYQHLFNYIQSSFNNRKNSN